MNDGSIDHPVFVLAYMHSGTTLFQQIMGRHSAIFVSGGETRHFSNLNVTRQKFPNLNDDQILRDYLIYLVRVVCSGYATVNFHEAEKDKLVDLEEIGFSLHDIDQMFQNLSERRDYTDLYLMVFDFLTNRAGKTQWLDKLPGYVSQFDQIRTAAPNAKFIELVRDGRDILASKKKRVVRGGGFDPLWDSLAWKSAINAGSHAGQAFPDQVLRIKYENLVSSPAQELRKICQFIGRDFEDDMLGVGWINTTTSDENKNSRGISTAAVGKYIDQLTPGEIALSQNIIKKQLSDLGYEIKPSSWSDYLSTPVLLIKSAFEFFGRLFNRWRQGGFQYLLNVLNNYFTRFRK